MNGRSCRVISVIVSLFAAIAAAKTVQDSRVPPHFIAKTTWQDTLLASREALLQAEGEAEKQEIARKAADPILHAFKPLAGEVIGKDSPRNVRIRVAGLKKLYIGAGEASEVFFGDPRWIDHQGKATPVELTRMRMIGRHLRQDRSQDWKPVKIGGQVFERGFEMRDSEICLELDGKSEWLELSISPRSPRGTVPTPFWIDYRSIAQRKISAIAERETLWRLTGELFPQRQWLCERHLEETLGIWKLDWKSGDFTELANRYAARCDGQAKQRALQLAQAARTPADLNALRDLCYFEPAKQRLELAQRTLEFVASSAPRPRFAADLKGLVQRLDEAHRNDGAQGRSLYWKACDLRRRIIFSHPLLSFDRMLINKRTGRLPEHMCDQYLGRHSQPGAGLVVLDSWREQPKETVLLEGKLPAGGLIHPDLSFDGKRVLFAFADHENLRKGNLRGYCIYELSLDTGVVRQVTGTYRDPMVGQKDRQTVLIEDFDPCYLPDGGFAFVSTRSQQFGRCHGGRYVPSYTLYRGELDGSNFRPLSFNESNEWGPSVLPDGMLVYTRWDYINRHDTIFQSLWVMKPDGTATAHYYGNNSRSPCFIGETRAIPGTHKVVATAAAHHGQTLGTLIVIDPYLGQDSGKPLTWITPELAFPESGIPEGIAVASKPLPEDAARCNESGDHRPRAATPYPLSEDLFLAAYQDGSQYAIYLIDTLGGRELIYADSTISCFDPIPLRATPQAPVIPSSIAGREKQNTGQFFIQDVYQSSHPIERGTIKGMRINEIISQPTSSAPVRSWANNEIVKRVLGTVPVQDDGSTAFEAPANTPLQLQLLDEHGMAVMTMRSVVYLQPGEKASCVGCHESRQNSPLASAKMKSMKIHRIRPPAGPHYEGGMNFVRTVQPVLDRYCVGCHGLDKTEGQIDLLGTMENIPKEKRASGFFTRSYLSLVNAPGLVKIAQRNSETYPSRPKDYFAHAGRLAQFLMAGHPDRKGNKLVELDRESFQRIVDWLDVNAQFYGDYSFNRAETQPPAVDGEKALRAEVAKRFGPELAEQPYAALVNVAMPEESRILRAPLSTQAGGWGQIGRGGWSSTSDPSYLQMKQLVEASLTQPPNHDIAGTCGAERGCRCGTCWVRKDREANAKLKETATPVAAVGGK